MEPENIVSAATEALDETAKKIEAGAAAVGAEGTAVAEAIADSATPNDGATVTDNDPAAPSEAIAAQEAQPPGAQE